MQENKTILLKDRRILGYAEYGNVNGKPLFFFHGWPSSRLQANIFEEVAKKLKIRVISIDRPGYGLSDFKKNRTLLDWSDDIMELADSLKIKKFAVVGVSGGGPYAAACAYKIPKRLTRIGIVVGLSPTNIQGVLQGMALLNKLSWRSYYYFPFLVYVTSSIHVSQIRRTLQSIFSFVYRTKVNRKQMPQKVKADIARNRNEAYRQGKQAISIDLKLYTSNWGFTIKDIKAKIYLWYGEADKNVSIQMGKYYASQIKDSTLTIYPNEGHFLLRKHAEEILKILVLEA